METTEIIDVLEKILLHVRFVVLFVGMILGLLLGKMFAGKQL